MYIHTHTYIYTYRQNSTVKMCECMSGRLLCQAYGFGWCYSGMTGRAKNELGAERSHNKSFGRLVIWTFGYSRSRVGYLRAG